MIKLKEKMNAIRDAIELADDRETTAKFELKSALERCTTAEEDIASHRRRLELLKAELEKTNQSLDEAKASLESLDSKIKLDQEAEKELGDNELETDGELAGMELKCKEAIELRDQRLRDVTDVSRKRTKVEYDLDKELEKLEVFEAKIKENEENLKTAGEKMVVLNQKDELAANRETDQEEKIEFMKEELKPFEERYDSAVERQGKLERYLDEITLEYDDYIEKKQSIQDEMDEIQKIAEDEI